MNREIKFRAWDNTMKCLVFPATLNEIADFDNFRSVEGSQNHDFIWQQFTGLLDKNGKEIYEGDILKINRDIVDKARVVDIEIHIAEVKYLIDAFILKGRFSHHRIVDWFVEVIGNIFENPELLK